MPLTIDSGSRTGVNPSPTIWSRVKPADKLFRGAWKHFFDDFYSIGLSTAVASNVGRYSSESGQFITYEDTNSSAAQLATEDNGVFRLSISSTDNDAVFMMPGGAASVMVTPKTRANYGQSIFFEARIRKSTIVGNFVLGIAEEGRAAEATLADAGGGLSDHDYLVFHCDEDTPTAIDFKYNKAGAGAVTTVITGAGTLAADTWVKLGFIVDMEEGAATKRIKAFVDGVEQGTYVTNTAYENTTLFPTGEEMHFVFGGKGNNAAFNLDIDWARLAQSKGD